MAALLKLSCFSPFLVKDKHHLREVTLQIWGCVSQAMSSPKPALTTGQLREQEEASAGKAKPSRLWGVKFPIGHGAGFALQPLLASMMALVAGNGLKGLAFAPGAYRFLKGKSQDTNRRTGHGLSSRAKLR